MGELRETSEMLGWLMAAMADAGRAAADARHAGDGERAQLYMLLGASRAAALGDLLDRHDPRCEPERQLRARVALSNWPASPAGQERKAA